jgi:hypothetical protein
VDCTLVLEGEPTLVQVEDDIQVQVVADTKAQVADYIAVRAEVRTPVQVAVSIEAQVEASIQVPAGDSIPVLAAVYIAALAAISPTDRQWGISFSSCAKPSKTSFSLSFWRSTGKLVWISCRSEILGVPLYIAAIGVVMVASAVWRYRRRDVVGMVASLLMAVLCAYALMLSPASSEPGRSPIFRCDLFLRLFDFHSSGLEYRLVRTTLKGDPPQVIIEYETRTKLHAPRRSVGICEFDRDRRHIDFVTVDGWRSQIIYD